jgi:hypothetical protein
VLSPEISKDGLTYVRLTDSVAPVATPARMRVARCAPQLLQTADPIVKSKTKMTDSRYVHLRPYARERGMMV